MEHNFKMLIKRGDQDSHQYSNRHSPFSPFCIDHRKYRGNQEREQQRIFRKRE